MCGIIIDTTNKKLLIPKEVTDSVGATDNFGLLISPDKRWLAIVREDPLDVFIRTQARRTGRPSKKQSKMSCWDEEEEAFCLSMSDAFLRLFHWENKRYEVTGEKVVEDAIIFELPESTEAGQAVGIMEDGKNLEYDMVTSIVHESVTSQEGQE